MTYAEKRTDVSTFQNMAALGLALLIDFTDAVPSELLFAVGLIPVPIALEGGISVVQAAFLTHLDVPVAKALTMTGVDLIPFIDIIPWCTLAVLDKRFNLKIPYLTGMFNH
ncbi:hypothetical protein CUJ83_05055 [Methanocella sp. CWC-04]|uniref:Uncharacterized protein n=2 Tax=Methanooceanicella nereidis TaxID=2052831 RepID=A0AAP2RCJ0_9EURY|nr:hypothetical protein [Methanocella sp. CWC-04]